MMSNAKLATTAFTLVLLSALTGLVRPQCAERPGGCCPGRDDTCTAPRGDGSSCYCDGFCLRSKDPDCCPDVFNNCTALPATNSPQNLDAYCTFNGGSYQAGDSFRVNCNICTCIPSAGGYEVRCGNKICLIREEVIDNVNSQNIGWRASNYTFLWGLTLEEGIRLRLGTIKPLLVVAAMTEVEMKQTDKLPESFDSRQKWPGWIEGILDQGDCGSSWAVSTAAVASDRLSIQSNGHMRALLSAQNLLSCNSRGQRGCSGGHLDRAWYYMRRYGVVTDYCYPYRSGMDEAAKMNKYPCVLPRHQISPCPQNGATSLKYRASPPYRISPKKEDIMEEIFTNGPVQATMLVNEDFYSYRAGVYRYTRDLIKESDNNKRKGYHSVRILGWGEDRTDPNNPLPYWICANSWGSQWGENGYFKILRGVNESSIESFVLAVWGDVDMKMMGT